MDVGMLIIGLVLGLLLGAGLTRMLFMSEKRFWQEQLEKKDRQAQEQEEQLRSMHAEMGRVKEENIHVKRIGEERDVYWKESLRLMEDRFKSLSSEVLEKTNARFLQVARDELVSQRKDGDRSLEIKTQEIEVLLTPMKQSLESVKSLMDRLEKDRLSSHVSLTTKMQELNQSQKDLGQETANLVRALRTPQGRGRWGEIQLKRVVELAGMLSHCDFEEQVSITSEDGRLRPDMKIYLPGGKTIVVDAKTPLQAYLEAVETSDPMRKEEKLKEHAAQVKKHIQLLSQKSYWQQFEDTPEFVVMFLPGEPFFSAALEKDSSLIEYGMDQQVILSTPTTLIALLKSVSYGWQQDVMSQNAREISSLGKELYERIRVFAAHFKDLEQGLSRSVTSFNKAVQSFDKRILPAARRFEEYGIKPKKELQSPEEIERRISVREEKNFD